MQIIDLNIEPPEDIENVNRLELWDEFFVPIYQALYGSLDSRTIIYPHIDFDGFCSVVTRVLGVLNPSQIKTLRKLGHTNFSNAEWNKSPENKAMMVFLWNFPKFGNILKNIHLLADISIKACESCMGSSVGVNNFISAKQFIDKINTQRWTRRQTASEEQSGVSNLGGVSERLLEIAMEQLIDNVNFFKTQNQKIQSYGDFVLMCLPNNLWLSVKSNFARERLLASGYTTDILGVGFFTSKDEFTSQSKIRNFQRVGFLAMYLPDIPVSEIQVADGTNTYNEVVNHYQTNGLNLPININGTPFIRPLSGLHADISALLALRDIRNRTTLGF